MGLIFHPRGIKYDDLVGDFTIRGKLAHSIFWQAAHTLGLGKTTDTECNERFSMWDAIIFACGVVAFREVPVAHLSLVLIWRKMRARQ